MLRHTLVLPESDDALAARLLREAIEELDVILMLVFGVTAADEERVRIADKLANRTASRKVVWLRQVGPATSALLVPILGSDRWPLVAVLNFHDALKARIDEGAGVGVIDLELAFLEGHRTP